MPRWKFFIVALFLTNGIPESAKDLQLPFSGRWFVMQGGDTPNANPQHI